MIVVGLTGGIGTGKSSVSKMLSELGAFVLDADAVGHEIYKKGTEGWQEVVRAFGREVLLPDGEVDRKKLGKVVFSDPKELAKLNGIAHPRMKEVMRQRLEALRGDGVQVVVLEAAILIEAGWTSLVDEVWVVVASEAEIVRRLGARSGLSEEEVKARLRSQFSDEERRKHADVLIENDSDLEELHRKVEELWNKRIKRRGLVKNAI
ncbi:MAG: dephospho-CoA kinase [Chloroflexi bacterium]|nr:dephospho-CoA kinase [Chloroflexota bacterium]